MQTRTGGFLTGAIAGLIATVPMTALMSIGKRRLSWKSQEALPPRQITRQALDTVDLRDDMSYDQELVLTAINHFAYGAGAGAIYGRFFPPRSAAGSVASGVIYGLGIWSGSYIGWLPALGLYRSPAADTAERNQLMIAAHVVWGGSLGLVTYLLSRPVLRSVRSRASEAAPSRTNLDRQSSGPSCSSLETFKQ